MQGEQNGEYIMNERMMGKIGVAVASALWVFDAMSAVALGSFVF